MATKYYRKPHCILYKKPCVPGDAPKAIENVNRVKYISLNTQVCLHMNEWKQLTINDRYEY